MNKIEIEITRMNNDACTTPLNNSISPDIRRTNWTLENKFDIILKELNENH